MKKILIIIAIFIAIYPYRAFATKIAVSITPIASLVKILVKNEAEVTVIAMNSGCPEHYQASFGDLKKIDEADLVVYIDPKFDHFIAKLMQKTQDKAAIKLSDINGLKILDSNLHFWLDLDNVLIILEKLFEILSDKFPNMKENITANFVQAKDKIEQLKKIKKEKFQHLSQVTLASDSLEYLFLDKDYDVIKLFNHDATNPEYLKLLKKLENDDQSRCIILSSDQNIKLYKKFSLPIAIVESENWLIDGDLSNLFYNKYLNIIDNIDKCCSN